MSVAALIEAVVERRPTDAAEVFEDLIRARVGLAIDSRRVTVAESMLTDTDPGEVDFDNFVWPDAGDDDDLPLEFDLDDADSALFVEWLGSQRGEGVLVEKVLWTDRTGREVEADAREHLPKDHPVNKAIRQNGGAKYGSAGRHHDQEEGDHDGVHVELNNGRHMSAIVHHRPNGAPNVKVRIHDSEHEARAHIENHIHGIHESVVESNQGARNLGSMRPASRFRAAGAGKKPRKDYDRSKREVREEEGREPFLELSESVKDGYYVTNHENKLTHREPFKDSKSAIRHADKEETRTSRVHTVHHVKDGKIQKTWQYSDSHGSFAPHTDYKKDNFWHAGHVNEGVEQVDEISKGLLGRYVKKASDDRTSREISQHVFRPNDMKQMDQLRAYSAKTRRRKAGLETAVDRLTKEDVEQVDELSHSTMASYLRKAPVDAFLRDGEGGRKATHDRNRRRGMGMKLATKKIMEEPEPIQELSKKTLGAYAKAAHNDVVDRSEDHGWARGKGKSGPVPPRSGQDREAASMYRRHKYVHKAIDKLTKEGVEPIQELSKKTLGRYIDIASISKSGAASNIGHENGVGYAGGQPDRHYQDSQNKKHANRSLGIGRAVRKLVGSDPHA